MRLRRDAFTMIELLMVVIVIAVLAAIAVPNFLEAQTRTKYSRTAADMAVVAAALQAYAADHNRYPPNNSELRAFLQASLTTAPLNKDTLPTPTTATVSWTSDSPPAPHSAHRTFHYGFRGDFVSFPVVYSSHEDLHVLTTPVAYLTEQLPAESFRYRYGYWHPEMVQTGFLYLNLADAATSAAVESRPERASRYALLSVGPDQEANLGIPIRRFGESTTDDSTTASPFGHAEKVARYPAHGPYLPYDPTNGTVSPGDIIKAR